MTTETTDKKDVGLMDPETDIVDMNDLTIPEPTLEDLKYEQRRALREHEELLRAKEANPDDSDLRKSVDKAYDNYLRIQRQIESREATPTPENLGHKVRVTVDGVYAGTWIVDDIREN